MGKERVQRVSNGDERAGNGVRRRGKSASQWPRIISVHLYREVLSVQAARLLTARGFRGEVSLLPETLHLLLPLDGIAYSNTIPIRQRSASRGTLPKPRRMPAIVRPCRGRENLPLRLPPRFLGHLVTRRPHRENRPQRSNPASRKRSSRASRLPVVSALHPISKHLPRAA